MVHTQLYCDIRVKLTAHLYTIQNQDCLFVLRMCSRSQICSRLQWDVLWHVTHQGFNQIRGVGETLAGRRVPPKGHGSRLRTKVALSNVRTEHLALRGQRESIFGDVLRQLTVVHKVYNHLHGSDGEVIYDHGATLVCAAQHLRKDKLHQCISYVWEIKPCIIVLQCPVLYITSNRICLVHLARPRSMMTMTHTEEACRQFYTHHYCNITDVLLHSRASAPLSTTVSYSLSHVTLPTQQIAFDSSYIELLNCAILFLGGL